MRNRVILFGLAVLIWFVLKAVNYFFSGPQLLILLSFTVAIMIAHSLWLLGAQRRWLRKTLKNQLAVRKERTLSNNTYSVRSEEESIWQPFVDVFIAVKNEENVIENTLRNFFKIDYEKFFVWVINDSSTDKTAEIVQKLAVEYPKLKLINRAIGSHPGKSAALNDALPLAKGDVIAVFDADAYVEPNFLKIILPVLEPEAVGAVQAQKRIYPLQKGLLVNCQSSEYALDTYFQMGRDLIGGVVELRGNGQLIKRSALIDVGGWNNRAITDDLDLSMRLLINRWDIRFCPNAYVYEEGVTSIKALLRQRRRWAEGSIRRYLDYIFPLNSPTRLSLVERFDTLAFTAFFVVPALIFLETFSEFVHFSSGAPIHPIYFAFLTLATFIISQLNFFIALRLYGKRTSFFRSIINSLEVSTYAYAHWIPCVFLALVQIIFGKSASSWRPTEHVGHSTAN